MSSTVVVAVIALAGTVFTGICSIIAQVVISGKTKTELYSKLDKQSEISDERLNAKIEKFAAVTDAKIDELSREIREHNNFAKRVPIIETKVSIIEKKIGI